MLPGADDAENRVQDEGNVFWTGIFTCIDVGEGNELPASAYAQNRSCAEEEEGKEIQKPGIEGEKGKRWNLCFSIAAAVQTLHEPEEEHKNEDDVPVSPHITQRGRKVTGMSEAFEETPGKAFERKGEITHVHAADGKTNAIAYIKEPAKKYLVSVSSNKGKGENGKKDEGEIDDQQRAQIKTKRSCADSG